MMKLVFAVVLLVAGAVQEVFSQDMLSRKQMVQPDIFLPEGEDALEYVVKLIGN